MGFLDKHIPVLEGENAERFLEKANKNEEGDKIDFSKQIELYEKIIKKSHIGETDMVSLDKVVNEFSHFIIEHFSNLFPTGEEVKYVTDLFRKRLEK